MKWKLNGKNNSKRFEIHEWDSVILFCLFFFFAISLCKEEKDIFLNEWYSFKEKHILTYDFT